MIPFIVPNELDDVNDLLSVRRYSHSYRSGHRIVFLLSTNPMVLARLNIMISMIAEKGLDTFCSQH
jgi:hypothetical protein